jgi:hypothetical protein
MPIQCYVLRSIRESKVQLLISNVGGSVQILLLLLHIDTSKRGRGGDDQTQELT